MDDYITTGLSVNNHPVFHKKYTNAKDLSFSKKVWYDTKHYKGIYSYSASKELVDNTHKVERDIAYNVHFQYKWNKHVLYSPTEYNPGDTVIVQIWTWNDSPRRILKT